MYRNVYGGRLLKTSAWDTKSIMGSRRFIERIWRLGQKVKSNTEKSNKSLKPYSTQPLRKLLMILKHLISIPQFQVL